MIVEVQGLNRPDAIDSDVARIDPVRELESCNAMLDDAAALRRFYDANGYLLARKVLNPASVARARDMMLAVAVSNGLVKAGDTEAIWTGKPPVAGLEESGAFKGVSATIWDDPANLAVLAKLLGETPYFMPLVQYRIYPPGGSVTGIHQDGFYSAGVHDYRPVWTSLTRCTRNMGGLMIAVGQNNRGYLHNTAKAPPYPIPADAVPDDCWATTDCDPGDVLIVHPLAPHASRANNSDRLRVTFDARVQSSTRPTCFAGIVEEVTPNSIVIDMEKQGRRTFSVDERTYLRIRSPGGDPFEELTTVAVPGMDVMIIVDGDRAQTLRKAAAG
jgi:hypothetical protein